MFGFNIFDVLTWPFILLALFRGSYQTYQCLHSKDDDKKREMLEYWVVLNALLFILPWFDTILGWFLFGGIIGVMKLGLLIMVVVSQSNYGFMYKLLEEQFMNFVEPYIVKALKLTQGFRQQACDMICLVTNSLHQYILHILVSEMSDQSLAHLKRRFRKTGDIIKREELQREKGDLTEHAKQKKDGSMDSKKKSIFETGTTGQFDKSSSKSGLKKRKIQG